MTPRFRTLLIGALGLGVAVLLWALRTEQDARVRAPATLPLAPRPTEPMRPHPAAVVTTVTGRVVEARSGDAIPDVTIAAGENATLSGEDGRFRILLRSQQLRHPRLVVSRGGFRSVEISAPGMGAVRDIGNIPLEGIGVLRLLLRSPSGGPAEGVAIAVRVLGRMRVGLHRNARPRWPSSFDPAAVTDTKGRARLAEVPVGIALVLFAREPGRAEQALGPLTLPAGGSTAMEFVLSSVSPVEIRFEGEPLQGATGEPPSLRITRLGGHPLLRFPRLVPIVPPATLLSLVEGSYRVELLRMRGPVREQRLDLPETRELVFHLPRLLRIGVHVEDESGAPVSGFRMAAVDRRDAESPLRRANLVLASSLRQAVGSNGRGILEVPGTGRLPTHVLVFAPGFRIGAAPVEVRGETDAAATTRLEPAARLLGLIEDAETDGTLVLRLRRLKDSGVAWAESAAPEVARSTIGKDGRFEIPGCGAGTYELRLETGGASQRLALLELPDRGTIRQSFRWPRGVLIVRSGGPRPPPVGIAPLDASGRPEARFLRGTTGRDGSVRFEGLVPGMYAVGFRSDLRDASMPRDSKTRPERWVAVSIPGGKPVAIEWQGEDRPESVILQLRLPATLANLDLLATVIPNDRQGRLAAWATWWPVAKDGSVSVKLPNTTNCSLVVAVPDPGRGPSTWGISPVYCATLGLGTKDEDRLVVAIPAPGRIRIARTDPALLSVVVRPAAVAERGFGWSLSIGSWQESLDSGWLLPGPLIVFVQAKLSGGRVVWLRKNATLPPGGEITIDPEPKGKPLPPPPGSPTASGPFSKD